MHFDIWQKMIINNLSAIHHLSFIIKKHFGTKRARGYSIDVTNSAIIVNTVDALDLLENRNRTHGFKLNIDNSNNDVYTYGLSILGSAGYFDGVFSFDRMDEDAYKTGENYANGLNSSYRALDKS